MTHWAYVEFDPGNDPTLYEHEVEHHHTSSRCADLSEDQESTILICDAFSGFDGVVRHTMWSDTQERVLSAARVWAYTNVRWGVPYEVHYIGEIA